MADIIFSQIPIEELKIVFSEIVKNELSKLNVNAEPPQQRETYGTRKEVAKELHISLPTLSELSKTGIIKSYKIQGRVLYKWEDVLLAVKEVRTLKYKR